MNVLWWLGPNLSCKPGTNTRTLKSWAVCPPILLFCFLLSFYILRQTKQKVTKEAQKTVLSILNLALCVPDMPEQDRAAGR